jgi:hypothetical protein
MNDTYHGPGEAEVKKRKYPGYDAALCSACFNRILAPHGTLPEAMEKHYAECPKRGKQ